MLATKLSLSWRLASPQVPIHSALSQAIAFTISARRSICWLALCLRLTTACRGHGQRGWTTLSVPGWPRSLICMPPKALRMRGGAPSAYRLFFAAPRPEHPRAGHRQDGRGDVVGRFTDDAAESSSDQESDNRHPGLERGPEYKCVNRERQDEGDGRRDPEHLRSLVMSRRRLTARRGSPRITSPS